MGCMAGVKRLRLPPDRSTQIVFYEQREKL